MRSDENSVFYKPAVFLQALANDRRLHILALLTEREWDVTSLALEIGLSQSALSQHLAKLRSAELVSVRKQSQQVWYRCDSVSVGDMLVLLSAYFPKEADLTEAA